MTEPSKDPHRLLAGLHGDGVSLDLNTLDVCFLAALHLRGESEGLASYEEGMMLDMFDQICDLAAPGTENSRKRATHTIQKLRTQRMLARVDASGVVCAGEYTLTGLATVIVKSFLDDEQLTRESLALLTGAVISSLNQIRAAAIKTQGNDAWRSNVISPLRVTVGELVGGIERRQRGLDGQQREIQRQIGELLKTDWFGAVEQCQSLLEIMSTTLRELNEVLLRDSSHIQSLLQEVQQMAGNADAKDAEEACQRVGEQVDRMAAWSASRQQSWSGYYQHVHRFLRDVVRLDPGRALSQRLLEQVRTWNSRPFSLFVASDARIQLLRAPIVKIVRSPVGRPRSDHNQEIELIDASADGPDIELLVRDALNAGAAELAAVSRQVTSQLDTQKHYLAAGQVAEIVAKLRTPVTERPRPWVAITECLEIEDWKLKSSTEDSLE